MLIGHKKQWKFLQRLARNNKVPHALLFSGPEQLGKRAIALEFVKLLNCQSPTSSGGARVHSGQEDEKFSCQSCPSCYMIQKGSHPDLQLIEPEKNEKSQIAQIRQLQEILNLRLFAAKVKCVIIDEAHYLNTVAQNALLKTLEEAPPKSLLVLISSQAERLLKTLLSRLQELKFYPLLPLEMRDYLLTFFSLSSPEDLKRLNKIIAFSEGKPGKAIDFLKNPEKLDLELRNYELVQKILATSLAERFVYLKELFSKKEPEINFHTFLKVSIKYLREILLGRLGCQSFFQTLPFLKQTPNLEHYPFSKIKKTLQLLFDFYSSVGSKTINQQLALENLMLYL